MPRTWWALRSDCLFLSPKFRFLVQKSNFCHITTILVNDPFFDFDFPFLSYSCFRKKIRLTCQKVFPLPTVGFYCTATALALSARGLEKLLERRTLCNNITISNIRSLSQLIPIFRFGCNLRNTCTAAFNSPRHFLYLYVVRESYYYCRLCFFPTTIETHCFTTSLSHSRPDDNDFALKVLRLLLAGQFDSLSWETQLV